MTLPAVAAPTRVRYLVLAALCVATTIAYIDRGCISVAEKDIRWELDLSTNQMGDVLGAFFLSYAIFQIPAGALGHAWGSRRALTLFSVLWSVATGIGAIATGFTGMLISRLFMGAAEAGIFPCATSTMAKWFPSTRRAWVSGVLGSFMGIGAALGASLTGLLVGLGGGWQWIFALYALPGLIWAGWFYLWFRDRPEDHPSVNAAELQIIHEGTAHSEVPAEPKDANPYDDPLPAENVAKANPVPIPTSWFGILLSPAWRAILTSPAMGWISAQQFFRAAGYVFYMSWFPTFLKETRGVSTVEAGALTSLPLWAQMFGSVAGGLLSDWILSRTGSRRLSRQGLAAGSQAVCAVLIMLAFPVANALLAVLLISLGAFSASLAGPCAYAITIDMGGKQVAPVFSVMNMAGNLGGVVFPVVVSRVISQANNWDLVLLIFAGVHVAAAACWLPFNPDKPIVTSDEANHAAR
jgi:MFS family permease